MKISENDSQKTVLTHSFEETTFVAVTAYQNDEVKVL